VNFDFPDEVRAMQQQASDYLTKTGSRALARKVLDGDGSVARRDWAEMADMGWTGLTISEEFGGNEIGYIALCGLSYELGRHLTPAPFASSVYLVAEALTLYGSDRQKSEWLPGIAAGTSVGCFAQSEGLSDGSGYMQKAKVANGKLSGSKKPVADGMCADFAIVRAQGDNGEGLYIVDLAAAGVGRTSVKTVEGLREHATITFENAPADLLVEGTEAIEKLFERAAVMFAFEQVGGAQACLDMSVAYAQERYAFGRAIGSFQAIKHKLADMFVATELARSNAYFAAWALSTDAAELPVAAATARLSAGKAFWLAAKENIQTHGGIGFTWDVDAQLYYRRHKALKLNIGAERFWEDRLIDGLSAGLVEL
jgi:alkylation response protein AidB-like acyl-CoA dehydrogenase